MPELPEVQTVVNDLHAADIVGRSIRQATVYWHRSVRPSEPSHFCRTLRGRAIQAIERRGKYIVFRLDQQWHLLLHLRMSGRVHTVPPTTPRDRHEHVVLTLSGDMQLRLHDTRKFGRLHLTRTPETVLDALGPEPLDPAFTARHLAARLAGRRRMLKPLLLDQSCIAGLGNIYVDEALWDARLHPCRAAATLGPAETAALHRAIRRVLRRGLANLGTTLGSGQTNFYSVARRAGRNRDQLRVFRRTGLPCPRCNTPVERIIVQQRSTHLCPRCQAQASGA